MNVIKGSNLAERNCPLYFEETHVCGADGTAVCPWPHLWRSCLSLAKEYREEKPVDD